ncbi:MAG: nicotinate phosphoribosyltransferase [Acidobacteria bacterium]|nr:MAG: nicotinate phosphoribosyltransferase [Acidobacteriota bacterium]
MSSSWVNDSNAALLTDFYELTMLQSYFDEGMNGTSVFDLFVRRLPRKRNYLVACGLEHVLDYLETVSFSADAIDYLRSLHRFSEAFVTSLAKFQFTGDVYAVREGTVVFANEPILEVVAPLPQAQLVETFLMNQIQLATLAASKAARVVHAARGRSLVDFGLRRMHGADAGLKEARAFYIAGVGATSNVLAGRIYGIPVAGTMAHSYIQACESEMEAFRRFVRSFPEATLLVDTYDTLKAVRAVIELARELGSQFRIAGIRLDSGDLIHLAREARRLLDGAGLNGLKIFASSSLDEHVIESLLAAGAPIDGFGVGGHMGTSEDAPFLDTAYKLVEYAGVARMKLSAGKSTLPGRKQIFRERLIRTAQRDVIGLAGERLPGEPLLIKVMEGGRRISPPRTLDECRAHCKAELDSLPEFLLDLSPANPAYTVDLSTELRQMKAEILKRL